MFHVIDDNAALCELTAEIIKSSGQQAKCFTNPKEYLDKLLGGMLKAPKAIFTDIRMPEIDGHTLIRKVHEKLPNQKIIVISGYDEERENSKERICHFLSKPYSPQKILEIVDAILKCNFEGPGTVEGGCQKLTDELMREKSKCPLTCHSCET